MDANFKINEIYIDGSQSSRVSASSIIKNSTLEFCRIRASLPQPCNRLLALNNHFQRCYALESPLPTSKFNIRLLRTQPCFQSH